MDELNRRMSQFGYLAIGLAVFQLIALLTTVSVLGQLSQEPSLSQEDKVEREGLINGA